MQLLPERHPRQPETDREPYRWTNVSEIGADILAASPPVPLTYVPSDEGGNTSHGFKFLAPVDRYVYVQVKDGVAGTGGYISGKPFLATVRVEPYHQALTFLGQGALLSLTGDRKVGFLVRDVDEVDDRDRPRAAEPAASSRAAHVGIRAAVDATATSRTSWSSGSA